MDGEGVSHGELRSGALAQPQSCLRAPCNPEPTVTPFLPFAQPPEGTFFSCFQLGRPPKPLPESLPGSFQTPPPLPVMWDAPRQWSPKLGQDAHLRTRTSPEMLASAFLHDGRPPALPAPASPCGLCVPRPEKYCAPRWSFPHYSLRVDPLIPRIC